MAKQDVSSYISREIRKWKRHKGRRLTSKERKQAIAIAYSKYRRK